MLADLSSGFAYIISISFYFILRHPSVVVASEEAVPRPYDERILVASCNHQTRESVWDVVKSKNASQAILLGDNVYADIKTQFGFIPASPERLAYSYCTLNGDPAWRRFVKSLGGYQNIAATLDDHDMGLNNVDSKYVHKEESMKYFLDFLRVDPESPRRRQSGVYSSVMRSIQLKSGAIFKYKIVLLDTRYNYVKVGDKASSQEPDFLGEEQWAWLSRELNDAEPDLVLLGSGIMVLPTDKIIEETWYTHAPSRNRLLNLITHAANPNIVLLSGDVHSAEASEVTCLGGRRPLHEFTSSGLTHSFVMVTKLYTQEHVDKHYGCDASNSLIHYELDPEGEDMSVIDPPREIFMRSYFFYYLHKLYMANYPAYFRYPEHYIGMPNFGTLDINIDSITDASQGTDGGFRSCSDESLKTIGSLKFTTFNHHGVEVFNKTIPIYNFDRNCTRQSVPSSISSGLETEDVHKCIPLWGPIPSYRDPLFRAGLVIPVFFIVILPGLYFTWLVIASIWYVFYAAEAKRREKIEANFRKIKQL